MALRAKLRKLKELFNEEVWLRVFGPPQGRWTLTEFGVEWIFVELTNHCNMHCQFCPSDSLKRKRGFMSLKMFQRVIDELAELKPPHPISLHVLGEPLMHPDFFQCLDYCAQRGLAVYLFSNGLMTERKIAEICRRENVEALVLSLQTPTEESFALRGVNKSFAEYRESALRVVRHVVEQGASKRMRVEIHLANTSELPFDDWRVFQGNEHAVEVFKELGRDLKRIARGASKTEAGNGTGGEADAEAIEREIEQDFEQVPADLVDKKEWEYWGYEPIPNVFIRMKSFGTFGAYEAIFPKSISVAERQKPGACGIAKNNLCVLSDGTITVCCVDVEGETRIGHMKQRGIYRALHSVQRARMMQDVSGLQVCRRCMGTVEFRPAGK